MNSILEDFASGSSMQDGVSGKMKIHTQFENYQMDYVQQPRSLGTDRGIQEDTDEWCEQGYM